MPHHPGFTIGLTGHGKFWLRIGRELRGQPQELFSGDGLTLGEVAMHIAVMIYGSPRDTIWSAQRRFPASGKSMPPALPFKPDPTYMSSAEKAAFYFVRSLHSARPHPRLETLGSGLSRPPSASLGRLLKPRRGPTIHRRARKQALSQPAAVMDTSAPGRAHASICAASWDRGDCLLNPKNRSLGES
jgi:hypothetical protein